MQSPPPARELPADKTTPLSKILALQDQKKRHDDKKGDGNVSPSWEEYKEDLKRQKEERKLNGSGSGWFGFGKKEKEE